MKKINLSEANNILSNSAYNNSFPSETNIAQNTNNIIFREIKNLRPSNHINGFTLIELMISLSVFCLLIIMAAPSFKNLIFNTRLTANSDSLINALNYARSRALTEAINVVVCPIGSPNSTACGGSWSSGWIVVTQPTTGTATLLKSLQFSPTDPVLTSNVSTVVFDSHGIATTQSNFKFCDSRGGSFAKSIVVMATGFVQGENSPGRAIWNNSALSCP